VVLLPPHPAVSHTANAATTTISHPRRTTSLLWVNLLAGQTPAAGGQLHSPKPELTHKSV
jgi:hypothetical protein